MDAFDNYWNHETPGTFGKTPSAVWNPIDLPGIDAQIAFSPHLKKNALIPAIADDIAEGTLQPPLLPRLPLHDTRPH